MNSAELLQWAKTSQPDWTQLGVTILPRSPRGRKQGPHVLGVPARLQALLPLQPGTTYRDLVNRIPASYASVKQAVCTLRQRGFVVEVSR